MKGVILAGGTGSRLRPLTQIINKHLLPVGKYPMIHYSIAKLAEAGVSEILLITGKQSAGMYMDYIGSGSSWKVSVTYKVQDEAGGIAQALALAEGFVRQEEKLVVLLGDNLFTDSLASSVQSFRQGEHEACVFIKEVQDPRRYGVPTLVGGRITSIEEKPSVPKSNYCVTGIYMYDGGVFDIIRTVRPSARGELEITDVNNVYASKGTLTYHELQGWWTDAGTHRSLQEASNQLMEVD
jgi:glucose-1-phosphate thymidylyltransferase